LFILNFSTITSPRSSAEKILSKKLSAPDIELHHNPVPIYSSYENFKSRISSLKLPSGWVISTDVITSVNFVDSLHMLPKYEILINNDLKFTIRYFTWSLPDDHELYISYERSLNKITLSQLIKLLNQYKVCNGIIRNNIESHHFINHNIPLIPRTLLTTNKTLHQIQFIRSIACKILNEQLMCSSCSKREKQTNRDLSKLCDIGCNSNPTIPFILESCWYL